jgi:hypothetical protein
MRVECNMDLDLEKIADLLPPPWNVFGKTLSIVRRCKKMDENGNLVWEPGQESFNVPREEVTPALCASNMVITLSTFHKEVVPSEKDDDFVMNVFMGMLSDPAKSDDEFAKELEGMFNTKVSSDERGRDQALLCMTAAIAYCARAVIAEGDKCCTTAWQYMAEAKYWSGIAFSTWEESAQGKKDTHKFLSEYAKERP